MSRTIQRYQIDFGLAMARELQRNQERSRRGKTPLEPSLTNKGNQVQSAAAADASSKANAAQSTAISSANSTTYGAAANAEQNAKNYAAQLDAGMAHVPSGAQILWDAGGGIPSGYTDTGYTINLAAGVNRRVLRKQ